MNNDYTIDNGAITKEQEAEQSLYHNGVEGWYGQNYCKMVDGKMTIVGTKENSEFFPN
jgi:hypothetical protein